MENHQLIKVDGKRRENKTKQNKKQWGENNNQKAEDKIAVVNPYISIITLSENGLNKLIKSYRVARWIKKEQTICYLPETHLISKETYRLM